MANLRPRIQKQFKTKYHTHSPCDDPSTQNSRSIKQDNSFSKLSKVEKCKINKQLFPYKRACHYYHDLTKYPRVGKTSYVKNIHPFGSFHDKRLKNTYQVEKLINREYFGLVQVKEDQIGVETKKNVCEEYLFKNEARKLKLDEALYQLQYIERHPQILQNNTANRFDFVKKDVELQILYDKEYNLEEKMDLLRQKIQCLKNRKSKVFDELQEEDDLFYKLSLDHQFFNQRKEQVKKINIQSIIDEAIFMAELNYLVSTDISKQEDVESKIKILFSVFTTTDKYMPIFEKQYQIFLKSLRTQEKIAPSFIFRFENKENLNWVGQVLLFRVYQVYGESCFYSLKNIWKNIFQEELVLTYKYAEIDVAQYSEAIRIACQKLKPKKVVTSSKSQHLPKPKNYKFYFQQESNVNKLSTQEYVVLYLIYYLYQRANLLNLDYRIVGSELFDKYQYKIMEKIKDQSISSFNQVVKKCTQQVAGSLIDSEIPIEFYSEYISSSGFLMVWIEDRRQEEDSDENAGSEYGQEKGEHNEQEDEGDQENEDSSSFDSLSLEFANKKRKLI